MSDREVMKQALDALKKADKISGYVNNNNKTAIKALEAALQQQAEPVALNYARRLAQSIWTKHYNIVEEWKPLDDLIGVLTQIDNMTSGLTRQQAEPVVEKMNINQGETK